MEKALSPYFRAPEAPSEILGLTFCAVYPVPSVVVTCTSSPE